MTDIRQKEIRSLLIGKTGSLSCLVRSMGLEPIRLLTHAPQTCLSAYSSTTANNNSYNTLPSSFCQSLFGKIYINFCRSFSGGYFRRTTEPLCRCRFLRHAEKNARRRKKEFSFGSRFLSVRFSPEAIRGFYRSGILSPRLSLRGVIFSSGAPSGLISL